MSSTKPQSPLYYLKIYIMTSFTKHYIGKGVQHETLDLVKVNLKMEQVLKFKHKFEGSEYLTFELARLQEVDKFGKTHTCYVSEKEKNGDEKHRKSSKKWIKILRVTGGFFLS